tara:strand:+ start:14 stop:703 length:690 start_codon:yes stop_codon:yes gene_type:complete
MKQKIILSIAILSLLSLAVFVSATMTHTSVEEPYASRGLQKYNVEVDIVKGWNLVSGFISPEQLSQSQFSKNNIKAIYAFVPTTQEYFQIYPDIYDDLTMELRTKHNFQDEELTMGAFWVYSEKEGKLEYTTSLMLPVDKIPLYDGWNFVSITPEVIDVLLEQNFGSCNIEKSYFWDIANNQWLQFPISDASQFTWDGDNIDGYGLLIKVSDYCNLGSEATTTPPTIPN